MKIRNILVTGASGKIGRHLVPALAAAGYAVRAIQFQTPLPFDGVDVVRGSICDPAFARTALKGMDAVCHLATCKEDREHFLDVSVKGTFNLLEAARESDSVRQFLLAGGDASLGIFFYPNPVPLNETAPLRAYPGYYAFSKVLEETMCNQYAIQYGLGTTILRFSWIQAEDDILAYMTFAEPNFGGPPWSDLAESDAQKAALADHRDGVGCLRHPGGMPFTRHIVGIGDVVNSILPALGNDRALGETYNIAAPAAFTYDVLSQYIADKLSLPVADFELAGAHDFSIDISKARAQLGYAAEWDVFRIVDDAIAFRQAGGVRSETKYSG